MNKNDFKPGVVVRIGIWTGVILDLFTSSSTGKNIVQINFAKNIYKQQPPELHFVDDLLAIASPATVDDFASEVKRLEELKDKALKELQAKIVVNTNAA